MREIHPGTSGQRSADDVCMTSGDEHGRAQWTTIVAFGGFGLAVAEIAAGLIGRHRRTGARSAVWTSGRGRSLPQLSQRERQVLELLAAGLSTTVIGGKLG